MSCQPYERESYVIRLWTEHDDEHPVLRGSIHNVQTGLKTYFDAIDLPLQLLRESALRLRGDEARQSLH
jgi:hypothetical protein